MKLMKSFKPGNWKLVPVVGECRKKFWFMIETSQSLCI